MYDPPSTMGSAGLTDHQIYDPWAAAAGHKAGHQGVCAGWWGGGGGTPVWVLEGGGGDVWVGV